MRLTCAFLSEQEKQRIHEDSLTILSDVGVKFMSAKARKILAENGARVNKADMIAHIPVAMVDQALKTAPRSFVLGARNPAFDFAMPSPFTGYTLDGAATFAVDFESGERRPAVTRDLVSSLRIFEELPLGAVVWPNVVLDDIPLPSADIRTAFLSLMHSSKHIQHEVHRREEIPYLIEGLAAILGGEDKIRKRKIFSVCYCTIPPLTHDADMCDAALELARYHVPILPYPMPACGSTGPASLYSDIAVANAESLSALILFQMAEPGTPIIYGHAAGIMNFRSGGFLEGAPESTLINGALGEMARFYHLPNTQAGCLTDAKSPGPQAIIEKMTSALPLVLSGVDVINGIGEIETSQLLVLEQIVVDHEIARLCKRMKDGVDVCDAKNHLQDVANVKPGGHFLMEPSTLAACHSDEFLMPDLLDRNTHDQWLELGQPDVYSEARKKVKAVLATPPKNSLPDAVIGKLEDILRRADQKLKSGQ
ncbi:MAG: trimethylamine methyltransferase family protein [Verrucomicrobia bacterium]|nr:trimethylamine methyltransferase family protein [Verrucomicrobiota bacterium]MBU1736294.1 trimethylamine methyltransferase family protein [Verrucomicrobiota bacterium]MBU1857409.1 trimethylamine methyltransferase family protein [Verrucomicrobiota bacterium]